MSAVNPILVVKNNLPDYRAEILRSIAKNISERAKLDEELKLLDELAAVLKVPESSVVASSEDAEYNET